MIFKDLKPRDKFVYDYTNFVKLDKQTFNPHINTVYIPTNQDHYVTFHSIGDDDQVTKIDE